MIYRTTTERADGASTRTAYAPGQYEAIFGHAARRVRAGKHVLGDDGKLRPATAADADRLRKRDAHDIKSIAFGCAPEQAKEFNQKFGHLGVKWDANGDAHFKNRQSRLRALKARGFHCNDEIRG